MNERKQHLPKLFGMLTGIFLLLLISGSAFAYTEGEIPGTAGIGTADSPIEVHYYAQLRAALAHPDISYINVYQEKGYEFIAAEDCEITFVCGYNYVNLVDTILYIPQDPLFTTMFYLNLSHSMHVYGNGSLTVLEEFENTNFEIFSNSGGHLILSENARIIGEASKSSSCTPVVNRSGDVTINRNTSITVSWEANNSVPVAPVRIQGGVFTIHGGTFGAAISGNPSAVPYGLYVADSTSVDRVSSKIEGGIFTGGIALNTTEYIANCSLFAADAQILKDGMGVQLYDTVGALAGGIVEVHATYIPGVVSNVAFNVEVPEEGKYGSTVVAPENISMSVYDWYESDAEGNYVGSLIWPQTYEAGKYYTVTTTIYAPSSFIFDTYGTYTINGMTAKVSFITPNSMTMSMTFKVGGKIHSLGLFVDDPEYGLNPVLPTTTENAFVVDGRWYKSTSDGTYQQELSWSETFKDDSYYTVEVLVNPAPGYVFAGKMDAQVGHGAASKIVVSDDGQEARIYRTFFIHRLFDDVRDTDYFRNAVYWAYLNKIANGTGKYQFSPHVVCNRGMAVMFLWNAYGKPEVSQALPFVDVSSTDYYYKALQWAYANGICYGTDANHFSPKNAVQRRDFIVMQWRAAGKPEVSYSVSFKDVKSTDYFYKAVCWALSKGITKGYSATEFGSKRGCERCQTVTFLYNQFW